MGMTAAEQAITDNAAPAGQPPALDDLMLAMDIVDTLRHDMRIAERELADDERREALKNRLREIYSSQGIDVPGDILEDGVRALEQDRFTYHSKASGISAAMARAYVDRGAWARRLALILLLGLAVWAGWHFGIERPRLQREAAVRAELAKGGEDLDSLSREIGSLTASPAILTRVEATLADGRKAAVAMDAEAVRASVAALEALRGEAYELSTLPAQINKAVSVVKAETRDADVLASMAEIEARGKKAAAAFDIPGARAAVTDLESLLVRLREVYDIRVVQEQGVPSGVWRIPDINPDARNYYLIVEAVGPDGRPIPMPVVSEETRKKDTVARWGVRVDQAVFDAIRRDKSDDGIIQNTKVAEKARGAAQPRWLIPVPPGAITEW
jgi:hypothetical protein